MPILIEKAQREKRTRPRVWPPLYRGHRPPQRRNAEVIEDGISSSRFPLHEDTAWQSWERGWAGAALQDPHSANAVIISGRFTRESDLIPAVPQQWQPQCARRSPLPSSAKARCQPSSAYRSDGE